MRVLDADNADTPIEGLEITEIEGLGGPGRVGRVGPSRRCPCRPRTWAARTSRSNSDSRATGIAGFDVWSGFYVDNVVVILN